MRRGREVKIERGGEGKRMKNETKKYVIWWGKVE
jgi:hypothetical protein